MIHRIQYGHNITFSNKRPTITTERTKKKNKKRENKFYSLAKMKLEQTHTHTQNAHHIKMLTESRN